MRQHSKTKPIDSLGECLRERGQNLELRQEAFEDELSKYVTQESKTIDLDELELKARLNKNENSPQSNVDQEALDLLAHVLGRADEQRAQVMSMLEEHIHETHNSVDLVTRVKPQTEQQQLKQSELRLDLPFSK